MQNGTIFEKSQNIFLKRGGVMAYLSDDELLDTEGGFTGWDLSLIHISVSAAIFAASSRCRNTWTAESAFFSVSRLRRSFVVSRMSFAS